MLFMVKVKVSLQEMNESQCNVLGDRTVCVSVCVCVCVVCLCCVCVCLCCTHQISVSNRGVEIIPHPRQ